MALRVQSFLGIAPRFSRRQLREGQAQVASNCVLTGGSLRPTNRPMAIAVPAVSNAASVFRMVGGGVDKWLTWDRDVDVARGPVAGDTTQRIYWTGDGEPRCSDFATATAGIGPYPAAQYVLGVFAPTTAPSVSYTGTVGTATSRALCYTFVNAWGEESAPSPASAVVSGGNSGSGQWNLTGLQVAPANTFTVTGGSWASGTITLTVSSTFGLRVGEEVSVTLANPSGYNTPRAAITALTATTISYAAAVNPGVWSSGGTISRRATHNTSTWKQRFYWTETSAGVTRYYYVGEQNAATTGAVLGNALVGEELPTSDWAMPPVGMHSIGTLPNGIMYGALGNDVLLSEPNKPYAWPVKYRRSSDFAIVGLASVRTTIVVATTGKPSTLSGVDPASMAGGMDSLDFTWPCLSKRSIATLGFGVAFAAPQGLVLISPTDAQVVTRDLVTEREWAAFHPDTFVAAVWDGRYYAAHRGDDGVDRVVTIDKSEPGSMFTANYQVSELWTDPLSGSMYMLRGATIERWEGDIGQRDQYDWWSREALLPKPVNMGAARVDADFVMSDAEILAAEAAVAAARAANQAMIDAGQTYGAIGEHYIGEFEIGGDALPELPALAFDSVQLNVYADNKLVATRTVRNTRPISLPAGYKSDSYSVRVSGNVVVNGVVIAETKKGLETA